MDFPFLYHRTKYFIINPVKAWEAVHRESRPMKFVRGSFFMPLIILVSASAFIGSMFFINTTLKPMYSVLMALNTFLILYLGVYGSALLVKEILKALDLGNSYLVAFKLVAYSMSPVFLVLIISRIFESMLFINVLGLYGLYLLWTGMEVMITPPEHKKIPFLIAAVFVTVIVFLLLHLLLSKLAETAYFSIFA